MPDFIISAFADEAAEDIAGQIRALKRNGLSCIELRNVDGKCIIDLAKDEQKVIREKLSSEGISVSAIASPIGKIKITDEFEPCMEKLEKAIFTAELFDTRLIRLFSFFMPEGEDPAQYEKEVIERTTKLCDYACSHGMLCCHENEKEIFGDIGERVLTLHRALGSKLAGIFDPANYVQSKQEPKAIFASVLPYTEYLHIKDAVMEDGSVVPAGEGDGSVKELIKEFYKTRSEKRILTVEPHLMIFAGLKNLQTEELKHRAQYETADEAFDAAVTALKNILKEEGFSYV